MSAAAAKIADLSAALRDRFSCLDASYDKVRKVRNGMLDKPPRVVCLATKRPSACR